MRVVMSLCVKRAFDEELAGVLVEGYRGGTTPSRDWLEGLSVGRGGVKVARSLCALIAREVVHVNGGARAKMAALYTRCICWTMQLVGVPVDWSRVGVGAALLKLVTATPPRRPSARHTTAAFLGPQPAEHT
jgi:hypothetical protein